MTSASKHLTVISFLRRAAQLFPDQPVVYDGNIRSYSQLYSTVLKLSAAMKQKGMNRGDVIAVADWNSFRFLALLYSSAMSGFVVYPVNIRLPPEHIFYTIRQSECRWLFASQDFIPLASKSGLPAERILSMQGKEDFGLQLDKEAEVEETEPVSGDNSYSIIYTSGTTGMPKGVLYTNEKVVLGAMSIVYQLGLFNASASLTSEDVIMPLIPFFHLWAWGSAFHAAYLGAKYVLGGKFSVDGTVDTLIKEGVTWINAIPTMIYQLLDSSRADELRGLGLKVLVGGSPIPKGLAEKMDRFGIRYSTIYGGTDMLATAIQLKKGKLPDSIHPVPFVEARVIAPDGKDAEKGEIGGTAYQSSLAPRRLL